MLYNSWRFTISIHNIIFLFGMNCEILFDNHNWKTINIMIPASQSMNRFHLNVLRLNTSSFSNVCCVTSLDRKFHISSMFLLYPRKDATYYIWIVRIQGSKIYNVISSIEESYINVFLLNEYHTTFPYLKIHYRP